MLALGPLCACWAASPLPWPRADHAHDAPESPCLADRLDGLPILLTARGP